MVWLTDKNYPKRLILFLIALFFSAVGLLPPGKVSAAELTSRSIRMSDAQASQNNVEYRVGFTTSGTSMVGSVRIQFCSNTSLVDETTCTPPAGFDASGVNIGFQGGITGFNVSTDSTANDIILVRPPASESSTAAVYNLINILNPSVGGMSFARIFTYPTSDGTGPYNDAGGLALYYRPSFGVSTEVPPFIKFCLGESISGFDCTTATEPFSDVGILGPLTTGSAQSQMVVATNADGGYTMRILGGTMTSGNNTIPALTGGASQKGVSQFGINLRANTSPIIGQDPGGPGVAVLAAGYNTPNQFRFQTGDIIASATEPDDNRKFTVSYIVNVGANQPGGVYATTLTYVALANF